MNDSVSGALSVFRRSIVLVGAVGFFLCADSVIGQTSGSRSNTVGSSDTVNDSAQQSGSRHQLLAANILSDTQGVDFGPYMRQALTMIKKSWVSSLSKEVPQANNSQTETGIRFTINRDGTVSEMELVEASHQIDIDRAAWGSIVDVGKLPSLPADFNGPNLVLSVHFRVNEPQQ
jgi:outer membrane biosynthesis protein TonB